MTNTKTKNKFNFDGKAVILTYKGHIDIKKFKFLNKNKNTHKLIWEIGESDYKHSHLIVMFIKRLHTRDCRFFDVDKIHPNIKHIKSKEHWENASKYEQANKKKGFKTTYTIKSDTLTGNEYEWLGSIRTLIQAHKRWQDVINDDYLTKYVMKYMKWSRECFDCKPIPNLSEDIILRNWQREEVELLEAQDRRKIRWVYGKTGNEGKSVLTDWLIDNKQAICFDGGKMCDIAYAYQNEETVVFDLPRMSQDFCPYKAMECFKNGRMFSPKYTSCMKRFKPAQVIVFANYLPDTTKLSKDRWDIIDLDKKLGERVLNINGTRVEEEEDTVSKANPPHTASGNAHKKKSGDFYSHSLAVSGKVFDNHCVKKISDLNDLF